MRRFKQILLVILLLIVALFVLVFILENNTEVAINFISFTTPQISLAILIITAFVLGLILALTVSYFTLLKIRLRLAITKKQLTACQKQLTNQNKNPIALPIKQ